MQNILIRIIKAIFVITVITFFVVDIVDSYIPIFKENNIVLSDSQIAVHASANIHDYAGSSAVFLYFTILSGILSLAVGLIEWVLNIKIKYEIKRCVMIYSLITMFIFWLYLAPLYPWGQNGWFDFFAIWEHLAVTLVGILVFIFSDKRKNDLKYRWLWFFSFPIIYLVIQIIFSATTSFEVAVYPFFNFKNFGGFNFNVGLSSFLTIVSIILIAGIFSLFYWLSIYLEKKIFNKINRNKSKIKK